MTNLIYQGKINRQFLGKLIRQSTKWEENVYNMLPGGGLFNPNLSNKITFFHSVKRIE